MSEAGATLKNAQKALMEGRFGDAIDLLQPLVAAGGEASLEPLYLMAVANRYAQDYAAAAAALLSLKTLVPELGRAWQEEGHLARDQGAAGAALAAYEAAVRFNPALDASWQSLAHLQAQQGKAIAAQQAQAQADRIRTLPKMLVAVMHHLYEGRLLKAEQLCRAYMKKRPRDTEGMRLLAEIGIRMSVFEDADILLENAVHFDPDNIQIRLDYIQLLRKRQKYADSLAQSKALMAREPGNPTFLSNVAIDLMHQGDFEGAVDHFDKVLAVLPKDSVTLTSKGHALKTWGRQEEAVACYQAAIASKGDHGDAWYGLANLKTYRYSAEERSAMAAALETPSLLPGDRLYLNFALAKACEDAGDYDAAFAAYAAGNALKKRTSRYDADQMQAELETQARVADAAFLARAAEGGGYPAADPIFIVGLPRAGSTLLEQILASHSQIDGTLELPHMVQTAHKLRGKLGSNRYGEALAALSDSEAYDLGAAYIEATRPYRAEAPYFTDKMPNNFRHIGLIKRILPHAKIIDARRAAMACCFSGFKQLFAEGQDFSYDLVDIGRYYRDYVALMTHFEEAAPDMVLRVQYEEVVADLEGQVRRILDYLGLPFEAQCVAFHNTERAVRTASSEQVREKINTKGLAAWQPYEKWLGPLKKALGPLA